MILGTWWNGGTTPEMGQTGCENWFGGEGMD